MAIAPDAVVTFDRVDGFRVVKSFGYAYGQATRPRNLLRSTFRSIGAFIGLAPIEYLTDAERAQIIAASPVAGVYDKAVDRESAFEVLSGRLAAAAAAAPPPPPTAEEKAAAKAVADAEKAKQKAQDQMMPNVERVAVPIIRYVGIALAGSLVRGLLGNTRRR